MCVSYMFGILATISTFAFYVFKNSWILNNISAICFLLANFATILALNNLLNKDISGKMKYLALLFIIVDIISFNFFYGLFVFLNKIVLMSVYIYLEEK